MRPVSPSQWNAGFHALGCPDILDAKALKGPQTIAGHLVRLLRCIGRARANPPTFECESEPEPVEWPGGLSPPGSPRTVREPLDSYGSRCSAVAIERLCFVHGLLPLPDGFSWPV